MYFLKKSNSCIFPRYHYILDFLLTIYFEEDLETALMMHINACN